MLPTDIECYVHDRIEQEIVEATVDRELDLLSSVCIWAIKTLRIDVLRRSRDNPGCCAAMIHGRSKPTNMAMCWAAYAFPRSRCQQRPTKQKAL